MEKGKHFLAKVLLTTLICTAVLVVGWIVLRENGLRLLRPTGAGAIGAIKKTFIAPNS